MSTTSWYVNNLRLQLRRKMERIEIEKRWLDKKRYEVIQKTGQHIDESTFYNNYDVCNYLDRLYCQANRIVANIQANWPKCG